MVKDIAMLNIIKHFVWFLTYALYILAACCRLVRASLGASVELFLGECRVMVQDLA